MSSASASWLDRFFASYYRQHPVSATFIGVREYDDVLPDYSANGIDDVRSTTAALLHSVPSETVDPIEGLDVRLARGSLLIQQWEYVSEHFLTANPTVFTGEAIFGVIGLLLQKRDPRARLAAIPKLLEQGEDLVRQAPAAWIDRARRECAAAQPLLAELSDEACAALARFGDYLQHLPRTESYAAGAEAFALLLREGHALDIGADEVERLALDSLAEVGEAAAEPVLIGERRLARCSELWSESRELAQQHDLLTFPDWPVRYVEQPAWAREAAPSLYFLPYRSPPPLDPPPVVDYFVPAEASESTIKLNHVVHHGSWGHHVQNWHALRAPSRIGRLAAVDCAARIALLCGGTLAEGWACYATDLAEEVGFLTPLEVIAQQQSRVRMAARAIVDVRLHDGRFTLDDAAAFYRERVGMPERAALAEAVKNSLFPATACMYLLGWDAIWRLRRSHAGDSLRAFHDRLLSFGSVPVALVSELLSTERGHLCVGVTS